MVHRLRREYITYLPEKTPERNRAFYPDSRDLPQYIMVCNCEGRGPILEGVTIPHQADAEYVHSLKANRSTQQWTSIPLITLIDKAPREKLNR